jgi:hypothetical protein
MRFLVFAALMFLSACATTPGAALDKELRALTSLLVGDYFSAADGGVREGRPIYMRIRAIDPPAGHSVALYAEMRHDSVTGDLYRQRVYLFDESPKRGANVMRALSFDDGAAAARLMEDKTLLAQGSLATKEPLAPGCVTVWTRVGEAFTGIVDPKTCQITGRRGDQRRIESRTRISRSAIEQLERGYDLEGKLLFGNPSDDLYVWPRVK